jgi:predicted dienelactone hydrolase
MKRFSFWFCTLILATTITSTMAASYNPLEVSKAEVKSLTFDVQDAARNRTIPIRVYLPETHKSAPVILFSHGLGGSRDNNPYLGEHWAKRGYVVVFTQHIGSDESVWKNTPPLERMGAMKKAASIEAYLDRNKDIPAVIDALTRWNQEKGHALNGVFDLDHIGMSGHSFGAVTTQAMAGQDAGNGRVSFVEKRIDAAVMMSPSIPKMGDPTKAFDQITIPCLLMTGTEDNSPIGDTKPEDRLKVFPNLTNAPAWQVVFDKANHMSFGQRDLAGKPPKNERYHQAILALSTAFWDATLRDDKAAKEWLNGEGAKKTLVPEDRWEINARAKG